MAQSKTLHEAFDKFSELAREVYEELAYSALMDELHKMQKQEQETCKA